MKAKQKAAIKKPPKVRMILPEGRAYQVRYTCPIEKREVRISTGTFDEQEALQFKKGIEAKLQLGLEVKPRRAAKLEGPQMPWEDFRHEYSRLKVATFRSEQAKISAENRLDIMERILAPRRLADVANDAALARLQSELFIGAESKRCETTGRSAHTVRSYMSSVIAALNWAHRPMKWLPEAVEFDVMDADDPDKGRPLCGEEFERMLAAVPKVLASEDVPATPEGVESWRTLLRGLWESGLRLTEAMSLSWDIEGSITPQWSRSGLMLLRIPAKMQKSRKAQEVPTTPKFASLIEATPADQRTGWVFNPAPMRTGFRRLAAVRVGKLISKIGEKANVVVNVDGKFASAHDLRRSFGQRMADAGLPPRDLQAIMRHASFTTTEAYYLRDRAQDQGERIAKYLGTVESANKVSKPKRSTQRPR